MDHRIAQAMVMVAHNSGHDEDAVRLYEGYSGRGMCGEETTGIVVDDIQTLLSVAAEVGYIAADAEAFAAETGVTDEITIDELTQELAELRTDSLGRRMIVY